MITSIMKKDEFDQIIKFLIDKDELFGYKVESEKSPKKPYHMYYSKEEQVYNLYFSYCILSSVNRNGY